MSPNYPKFQYVRSKRLLEACRELPCQHCGISDGTVVAAHSNSAAHGKGRSIKAGDQYVAAMCMTCHYELDQGRAWSRADREAVWTAAHIRTVQMLVSRGLWPAGVPNPLTKTPVSAIDTGTSSY